MADTPVPSDQQNAAPTFNIQRVYLKDASLEMPNSPQIFLEQDGPSIEVQIDSASQVLTTDIHEVVVTATVTARIQDKTLYLVEAKQAGIFQISNIPAEQVQPILGIMCPSIVYPYLRSNIADLISRTGLPAVTLSEINWEAFYQQRLAALQGQAAGARIQ
ncbi:MAG TPA: protein-export chaperone SecB [Burkholderiaceae bacterium]|nr:protein-export chaperone SecB [Burkholderiaceae bacterium]